MLFFAAPSAADQFVSVPDQITTELLRSNADPIGRPLPVAAHWNTGRPSTPYPGWDPDFVLDYLDSGEYVIPTFTIRMPIEAPEAWSHYQSGLARAAQLGLPIALRFTQWDRLFTDDPAYAQLPPANNPNVIDATDGQTILPMSDPDGPIARWTEAGVDWGSLPILAQIQAAYPDPPLVIWLNNFEQPRLRWEDAETSSRFVKNHGTGLSPDEQREIIGDGWIARDGALWAALHGQLTAQWQTVSIPVCYSAFGRRSYGVWNGWDKPSLHIPGRFSPWPSVVNGSPSYYVFSNPALHLETDYTIRGPQMAAMNWLFMLEEALRDKPDYFWEISVFDGALQRQDWYRNVQGQIYDTERYQGCVRFGLWLTRPRILREFKFTNEDRTPYVPYWEALLETVKEVHSDEQLKRFWRNGTLVANPAYPHPYQSNLYPGYTDFEVERNYLLEASANPPHPWNPNTEIEVWALAYQLGEGSTREWMVFAYAPLQDHDDVTVTIPGYGDILMDIPRGGGVFSFVSQTPSGVHSEESFARNPTLRILPNPFRMQTTIEFRASETGKHAVTVYDLRGALVRRLLVDEIPADSRRIVSWDGRDAAGRRVSFGQYFIEVEGRGSRATTKVLMID